MLLTHPSGITASVHPLGATLRSLCLPDRHGNLHNILVGFDSEDDWLQNHPNFGSTIGRYANRIANGRFLIDSTTFQLSQNEGDNHLHGGHTGFNKVLWKSERISDQHARFTHRSENGHEGYPGNLDVSIDFILGEYSLTWKATATTDQPSPISLTSHPYFNLSGNPACSILDHLLKINANAYLPVNKTSIPTGEIRSVKNSPFDFTAPISIGENLAKSERSFDHNYVLNSAPNTPSVRCTDPVSGRVMEIFTDQPGLQLYLSSPFGNQHSAFCLEPQNFPDAPNHPHFPNPILRPGETYSRFITFAFPQPD
jgi:aldose 1-epimerase